MDPAQLQEGAPEDADTTTAPPVEEDAAESPEESGEGADTPQDDQGADGEPEPEIEISIKGEEPPPSAGKESAAWMRMRRENAELKRQLQGQGQAQPETVADPGPKPTLAACDFDEAAFEAKLDAWKDATAKAEARKQAEAKQGEEVTRFWQTRGEVYAKGREAYSAQAPKAFAAAEAAVSAALSRAQQNVLLSVADDPASVVVALGRYPKLLEEVGKETDFIRLGAKLAKLEANLTKPEKPKSNTPPPEQKVRGSGSGSGGKDSTLEQLRAKADKTGDRTAVVEYLRKKREQKR